MAKAKRAEGGGESSDSAAELKLPPGVTLGHVLSGHTNFVMSVAFDPQGETLASGSGDNTVKLWDLIAGRLLRSLDGHQKTICSVAFDRQGGTLAGGSSGNTVMLWSVANCQLLQSLEGHTGPAYSVAFDRQSGTLASGSYDETVKLWDVASGRLLRSLDGHKGGVRSVAFDRQGGTLASGSDDKTVKLWDVASGRLLRSLDGHKNSVFSVAFDRQGGTLASGSFDTTVKLWEVASGRLLRSLEGHTGRVDAIAFSPDGSLLASKSDDQTIRLWSCATWETVAVIPVPTNKNWWIPALAFHPDEQRERPLLATASSPPDTPNNEICREIHLYELDLDVLLGRRTTDFQSVAAEKDRRTRSPSYTKTVHSATAKIVLVGDSGVGKTGLGWRLAHGEYREHDSTHGQQFWVLNQLATTRTDGTQCEAVLWDLAGQPDYRLIHALSIQDADLALILFDPTNNRDPLVSAEYWLRQLPASCPKILAASRVDRGYPALTDQELDAFCKEQGIDGGWIKTSARTNAGLDALFERIKKAIPWDSLPTVSTDAVFKRIKDFVLMVKESGTPKQVIFKVDELRLAILKKSELSSEPPLEDFTDAQLLAAVRHLSSQGFVRMVTLSSDEERILLEPELLNNLAAAFVLEAQRNLNGLGAIDEQKFLADKDRIPELDRLSREDCDLLIELTIAECLEHGICFRETINDKRLLVFPELVRLRPPNSGTAEFEDSVYYEVKGATQNTYTSLVVWLGYASGFERISLLQNEMRFQSDNGHVCGFRQSESAAGECGLTIFTTKGIDEASRSAFQSIFENVLSRKKSLQIQRFDLAGCAKCGTRLEWSVVRQRIAAGKDFAFCPECGEKVDLPLNDKPIRQSHSLFIETLEVENIRCFERLKLQFHEGKDTSTWNMCVGDNAAGKTTLLRAIAVGLCNERDASSLLAATPSRMVRHGEKSGTISLTLREHGKSTRFRIKTDILVDESGTGGSEVVRKRTEPEVGFPWQDVFVCAYGTHRSSQAHTSHEHYSAYNATKTLFDFQASLMNPEVVLLRQPPTIRRQMEQALLRILMLDSTDDSIEFDSTGLLVHGPWGTFPLAELSDGYRATLHWLADFLGWQILAGRVDSANEIGGILLVDELEQHLHPRWQRQIVARLRQQFPQVQFFTTTHTPLVAAALSDLPNGNLISVNRSINNTVEVRVLDRELLKGMRADQSLTSAAFGLTTSRSPGSVDDLARFTELSARSRTTDEQAELDVITARIRGSLLFGETEHERLVEAAVSKVLHDQLMQPPSEELTFEIKRQLQELFYGHNTIGSDSHDPDSI